MDKDIYCPHCGEKCANCKTTSRQISLNYTVINSMYYCNACSVHWSVEYDSQGKNIHIHLIV